MIKIMTDKMLYEMTEKAKAETFREMNMERKLDRLECQIADLHARIAVLENGETPVLGRRE